MLKPYEIKLQNIKNEISKIGIDVVNSLEISLRALEDKKIDDLKKLEDSCMFYLEYDWIWL